MNIKKIAKYFLCAGLLSLSFVSCTKERPEQFAQGQGTNLQLIADYQDKTFSLETAEELAPANITKAALLNISNELEGINNLPIVSYKTNANLLGDIPIHGKPNKKYEIRYRLTNNYLKLLKVANKEDLPYDEIPYAEKLADGRLAVPLLGYRVSYYRIEHVKNDSNENSNILIEMPESSMSRATHFKLDHNSRTLFQAETKIDVLPANIFDGEWLYASTITAAPSGQEDAIGHQINIDDNFKEAAWVKFLPSERELKVVNANIDDRLDKKDELNYRPVLEIPAEWLEYRVRKNGNENDLKEERVETNKWRDRPYVKIALDRARSAVDSSSESKLVDLEIAKNFFSFTQQKNSFRVKHSFSRIQKNSYIPKQAFEDDKKLFGFFTTAKNVFRNYEIQRKEDFEKKIFLSRFNPEKPIIFYFTASSPQWLRSAGRDAVDAWNNAFKKAGTKIEIMLDESKDVQLGDIRYNAINIIESLNDDGQSGLGPSLTDPRTGEIVSATANIYVTPILSNTTYEIRSYIKSKLGLFDANLIAKAIPDNITSNTGKGKSNLWKKIVSTKATSDTLVIQKEEIHHADCRQSSIIASNLVSEIENNCPEVSAYIDELKKQNLTHNAKEHNILNSCAKKIAMPDILGTLLHEMGHNFGLRHNFHASNDKENFRSSDETKSKEVIKTSSVMDYPGPGDSRPLILGKYDIAAIRFGYADQVETNSGEFIHLNITKSINENLLKTYAKIKPYKYCTDEDVAMSTNPMCARWDSGVTPLEVVENIIAQYHAIYATSNFRYDRYKGISEEALLNYKISVIFEPLKRIYDQWRFHLAQYAGLGKEYLEELNPQSYQELLAGMSKDPLFSDRFKEYYPASRKAYEFLRDLSILPNKYCVVSNPTGKEINIIELEKIRDEIYRLAETSVQSCKDNAVQKYLSDKKLQFQSEIGHHLNSVRYDQSLRAINEPFDVIGVKFDRLFAFYTLTQRSQNSLLHINKKFYPNFIDEPDLRDNINKTILPRVLAGLTIKELNPKKIFLKFEYEKDLLANFVNLLRYGNMIPGKDRINIMRKSPFDTVITQQQSNIQGAAASTQTGSYYIAAMSPQYNNIAAALIQTHEMLLGVTQVRPINPQIFETMFPFFNTLPESKDGATLTPEKFLEIMKTFGQAFSQVPEENRQYIAELMESELTMNEQLEQYIGSMQEENPEEVKKLLAGNLLKIFAGKKKTFHLFRDTIGKHIENYVAQVNNTAKLYEENKSDIHSQIDLLEKILMDQ